MPLIVSRITEGRIGLPQNYMDFVRQGITLVMMLKMQVSLWKCRLL